MSLVHNYSGAMPLDAETMLFVGGAAPTIPIDNGAALTRA